MTEPDSSPQPFTQFLFSYQRGQLDAELGEQLRDLVAAVVEHGKKGTLQLKVEVKPAGANAGEQLTVACDADVKPPKPVPPEQIFWADADCTLVRNDPHANPLFDPDREETSR